MNKGLSIKSKFISGTLIITGVLVLFAVFLIALVNQLANITSDIVNHPLEVSNAAHYANIEVIRMHKNLQGILLVDEDYEVDILVDKIRDSEAKVYTALDTIAYYILGDEGKQLQHDTRLLFDEWKKVRSEIIQAVGEERDEEANQLIHSKGDAHIEELEFRLTELNQYARKKASEFQDNSVELEANTKTLAILGIIIVLVITCVTIFWMSWTVLSSVAILSRSLKRIVQSGEFKSVELNGNDELTELSIIFNDLVSHLGDQLWVREGNQKLSGLLMNTDDFDSTLAAYMRQLKEYGNFLSVVYYDLKEGILSLKQAENRLDFLRNSYELGQSVVGECALSGLPSKIAYKQVTIKEDLPFKDFLVFPITYDEETYGVIGLATLETLDEHTMVLIDEGVKNLSTYVSAYRQRQRIDDLLEASIQANDQLTIRQKSLEENQLELQAANSELQDQRDLLNRKSDELILQNKELVNLREELFKKYKDLEEVTAYRSQFLSNVSHELRTPLNSIIVLSGILNKKETNDYDLEDKKRIEVITQASQDLLSTINDILDLSRVESGNVELFEEVFSLSTMVNEWQAMYQPLMKEKGITGIFECQVDEMVFTDRIKVSHIIANYISNAIKFTSEGYIKVIIAYHDDQQYPLRLSVQDTGIGIKKDKLDVIFDEFVQSDGSINRHYGGTGLGLAICKNYADLLGGLSSVESVMGLGSTFHLDLPASCLLDDKHNKMMRINHQALDAHKFPHEVKAHLRGKYVMVCDDEAMNVFSISAMLEEMSMKPVAALNFDEVLQAYKLNPNIDLVLMDYMMPDINGFEMLEKLKDSPIWGGPHIAIVTAASLSKEEMDYIDAQGYSLILKPISYDQVVQLINDKL